MTYLTFSEANHPEFGWGFEIYNNKEENIGSIRRVRVGRFMQWVFLLEHRHLGDYVMFSSGCQDEIRAMCKKLKSDELKKDKNKDQ